MNYFFYDLDLMIMLGRLALLKQIVDDGYKIITSEFRLSYFSFNKVAPVISMVLSGMIDLVEDGDDVVDFIQSYSDKFSHLGDGGLLLIHLCLKNQCVMVIDDEHYLLKDVAAFFELQTMSPKDFCSKNIIDINYREFLLSSLK